MTPKQRDELIAACMQVIALNPVIDRIDAKIDQLEAAGEEAAAYREVRVWLCDHSIARLEAALRVDSDSEA